MALGNNMVRILRDGVPCYVANWYNELTPVSKADMLRPSCDKPEHYRGNWVHHPKGGSSKKQRIMQATVRHTQTTYTTEGKR
jgi:hypothetical protein